MVEVLEQPSWTNDETNDKKEVKTKFIAGDIVEGTIVYWRKGSIFVKLAPKRVGVITKSIIKDEIDDLKTGSKVQVQIINPKAKGYDLKLLKKLSEPVKRAINIE